MTNKGYWYNHEIFESAKRDNPKFESIIESSMGYMIDNAYKNYVPTFERLIEAKMRQYQMMDGIRLIVSSCYYSDNCYQCCMYNHKEHECRFSLPMRKPKEWVD